MPSISENSRLWNEQHEWPLAGDEWSEDFGGTQAQWYGCLLPRIARFLPAGHILEIAPGYGRWTQFLQTYGTTLSLVDLAPTCIDACRSRFASLGHLRYYVNDGSSLDMIDDQSVDFVFSFDSLVHADADTMRAYCLQIGRKLHDGGWAFIHHSNLRAYQGWLLTKRNVVRLCRGNSRLGNYLIHDCARGQDMSAALMVDFCCDAGLTCTSQEIVPWGQSRRPIDCFTIFTKADVPARRAPRVFVNHRFMEEAAYTKRMALLYGP